MTVKLPKKIDASYLTFSPFTLKNTSDNRITGGKHRQETETGVKNIFQSQNNFMNDSDFIWTMMKLILVDWRKLF